MIGQEKLIKRLLSYSISTLPHSILLVGEYGCGKHTVVDTLKNFYNLDLVFITDSLTLETLEDISTRLTPAFYVIDTTNITEKQQNVILKFLEEPSSLVYIILLCESKTSLLETVVNRCVSFEFEPYTNQELMSFIADDTLNKNLVISLCNTPGRVKAINSAILQDMNDLCMKIIDKIKVANYANTLTISNKINYDKDFDKFDVKVFLNCLMYNIVESYKINQNITLYKYYNIIKKYYNRLSDSRLNKEMLIENTLTELWQESRK